MAPSLQDSIQYLKGVGPARAKDFESLGIQTIGDLLFTFPRDLSDRRHISTISEVTEGQEVSLLLRVTDAKQKTIRRGRLKSIVTVWAVDDTGQAELTWFNSPWILDKFDGQHILVFGKAKRFGNHVKMDHPQFELVGAADTETPVPLGRIVPIYPCTGKLNQSAWRRVMTNALASHLPCVPEILPPDLLAKYSLLARQTAVQALHFPESPQQREQALVRMKHEEAFILQLAISVRRRHARLDHAGRAFTITSEVERRIRQLLPFRLTTAQSRCVDEIFRDMRSELPMYRLLQGDVGSGKTVVAFFAMLSAVANHAQCCMMAPTGLLARQHEQTVRSLLANSKRSSVRVVMLSSGMTKNERDRIRTEIASGAADIVIATHAALQEDVTFHALGLVIIDEQHKFGVDQRQRLVQKGVQPDTLVMTATPIPRSLALTVYGDLDVSIIDELPPGRIPIKTSVISEGRQREAWAFISRQVRAGFQAFIVSPLLEENEELPLQSAMELYEQLKDAVFRECHVGLLHGKMKRTEQHAEMERFKNREIDVMVCTVVVEVGVDIPNATVMAVMHAERFGLAQLHQLRGRIGRGGDQGHFILIHQARTEEAKRRLAVLAESTDGFRIAEEDLAIRGPGEFLGTRQHGLPELKVVDIISDFAILDAMKQEARALLEADPTLLGYALLRERLSQILTTQDSTE